MSFPGCRPGVTLGGSLLMSDPHPLSQARDMRYLAPLLALAGCVEAMDYCPIRATPTTTTGVSYKVSLRLDPTCPIGGVARFRKTSTLTTKSDGHTVQPVFPNGSLRYGYLWSWTLSRAGTNMPMAEAWSLLSWRWEYYDPNKWNPVSKSYGAWVRAKP